MSFSKLAVLLFVFMAENVTQDSDDCHLRGHRLYGRVQIVDSFPDLKVQIVNSFPDLKVKTVDHNPTRCGEWQMVDNFLT